MNGEEIKQFRKKHGLTQLDLSMICGVGLRAVQSWEQGLRSPADSIIILMNQYEEALKYAGPGGISQDEIDNEVVPENSNKPIVEQLENNTLRPFIHQTKVACGSPNGFDLAIKESECERISIPFMREYDFSIEAHGDSMINRVDTRKSIRSGDIVACKKVKSRSQIRWGEVYALATMDGFTVKRVMKSEKEGHVLCVPFNTEDGFESFDIPTVEIFDWALVVGVASINKW